jgi:hypothetical protein
VFVELLCLPANNVAQPVSDVTAEFGIRRSRSLGRPFGRRLYRHALSVGELLAGDPPVVGDLLHRAFFLCGPSRVGLTPSSDAKQSCATGKTEQFDFVEAHR